MLCSPFVLLTFHCSRFVLLTIAVMTLYMFTICSTNDCSHDFLELTIAVMNYRANDCSHDSYTHAKQKEIEKGLFTPSLPFHITYRGQRTSPEKR